MLNKILAPGGSTIVTALPQDASGNTGSLQPGNVPIWSAPPVASGLSLVPAADGLTATVTAAATAPPGVTVITVQAVNSGGGGFSTPFSITVPVGPAHQFGFSFS